VSRRRGTSNVLSLPELHSGGKLIWTGYPLHRLPPIDIRRMWNSMRIRVSDLFGVIAAESRPATLPPQS